MKYIALCFVLFFSVFSLSAMDYGLQMSSDSTFGIIVYADTFEVSVKGQAMLHDSDAPESDDTLILGAHAGYLINLGDEKSSVSIGFDGRVGLSLGDVTYEQYIDAGPRLALNHRLNEHFMVSGIVFPFWVQVRETDAADSYNLTATIPSAAVSAVFFF